LHDLPDVLLRGQDGGLGDRLGDRVDLALGELGGVGDLDFLAVLLDDLVDHVGRGRDQVEVELALEALLDDLQVEQAEEADAEAEAERGGRLGLVLERGVVELQLVEGFAEVAVVGAVDRVEPGVD
ncbi:hypothetical protein ADL26_11750, partial [Thermoactinomyces vulgaris]